MTTLQELIDSGAETMLHRLQNCYLCPYSHTRFLVSKRCLCFGQLTSCSSNKTDNPADPSPVCIISILTGLVTPPATPRHQPFWNQLTFSSVLSEYHDLSDVLSKDCPLSLPPHRPYDCSFDLLPGATLPWSQLYHPPRTGRHGNLH